jgi:hypothetical protein
VTVSRYASVGHGVWTGPDGRSVPYLLRRLLPAASSAPPPRVHEVRPGERVDTIAAAELGDAELSWMLADANLALRPSELAVAGRTLAVPLPAAPGAPGGQ